MKRKRPSDFRPPVAGGGYANLGVIELHNTLLPKAGPLPREVVILPDGLMVDPDEVSKYAVDQWQGWVVENGWLVEPPQR
jgi:hypothetical protein